MDGFFNAPHIKFERHDLPLIKNCMNFSRIIYSAIVSFLLVAALSNCNNGKSGTPAAADTSAPVNNKDLSIPGSFSSQTKLHFDSGLVAFFLDSFSQFKVFEKDIYSFYQNRQFAYAWFDEKGLIETADNLHNRVINIADEGLPDKIPYKEKFTELADEVHLNNQPSPRLELMLTSQYLLYAKNVWEGLPEKESKNIEWLLPRKKLSYRQLLDSLSGNRLLGNEPVYKQYHLLKEQLKKLKTLKDNNQVPIITTSLKKIQEGDSAAVVADIRHWLFIMGDIAADTKSPLFDASLTEAVKRLQSRLGLKEDGVIGPSVINEMNLPLEKRMETIMVNMERSRWVPTKVLSNYLLVNIPDYKLFIFENDSVLFNMNVVVGKSQHKTVVFNGEVKYVVFSPYWNVPYSILKKEILPAIRRNPRYLARHNMEWNGNSVRQKPGPNNSLGLVKFLFPNSHSIYLHDTPSKSLFNESSRAFSHGCIRVSEPKKLASYLLRQDATWNDSSITAAMNSGKEKTVTLAKPVPVFIAYFTAWVDREGRLQMRKDVYDRDGRLAKMILENPAL
jgi:murein L,D-transpeptidase YcbB/YkuD